MCSPEVMVISPFVGFGGTERSSMAIARALNRAGIRTAIIANEHPLLRRATLDDIPVLMMPNPGRTPWGIWETARALSEMVRTHRPRVLSFQSGLITCTVPILRRLCPEWTGKTVWHDRGIRRSRLWIAARLMSQFVDLTVANCQDECLRLIEAGAPRPRTTFMYNYPTAPVPEQRTISERWNRKRDTVNVGLVCRLERDRRVKDFVDMAEVVSRSVDVPVRFTIVGGGSQRDELEQRVRSKGLSGVVTFTGAVQDVGAYYMDMDVFANPVCAGAGFGGAGVGNSTVEAMFSGLPVVATRSGGIPEFVHDGVNGFLAEPKNAANMGALVAALVTSDQKRVEMGRNARATALQLADPNALTARLLSLYGL